MTTGEDDRLPWSGLLALAMVAFVTLLTEIMPASMLSSIAGGLAVSESLAGQFYHGIRAGGGPVRHPGYRHDSAHAA